MCDIFPIQTNRTSPFCMIVIVNTKLRISICIKSNNSFPHIHIAVLGKHTKGVFFGSGVLVTCKPFSSCFYKFLMFSSFFDLTFIGVNLELGSPFLQEMPGFQDIQAIFLCEVTLDN